MWQYGGHMLKKRHTMRESDSKLLKEHIWPQVSMGHTGLYNLYSSTSIARVLHLGWEGEEF
jgi:hypothetical protein